MDGSGRFWWHGRITVLVPEFLHAIEPKPEIVPVVGSDVLLVQFVEGRVNHPESDLFIHLESGIYLSRSKVVCITPTDWFVQRTPKEASLGAA